MEKNNQEQAQLGCFDSINFEEIEKVVREKEEVVNKRNRIVLKIIAVIIILSIFITLVFGYNFWVLFLLFSIFLFAPLYSPSQRYILNEIADRNNFLKQRTISLNDLKGNIFKVIWYKTISNVLVGRYEDKTARFFNYSYTIEHGRSRSVYHFTVLEIFFEDISFPYMLLQYKRDLPIKSTRYGLREPDERKITLEDDFDKYYNLYVKDGYGVEAMQIFKDDFLAFLVGEDCNFSIELKDDRMYIYLRHKIRRYNEFKELFTTAGETIKRISPVLTKLKRDFDVLRAHYNKQ